MSFILIFVKFEDIQLFERSTTCNLNWPRDDITPIEKYCHICASIPYLVLVVFAIIITIQICKKQKDLNNKIYILICLCFLIVTSTRFAFMLDPIEMLWGSKHWLYSYSFIQNQTILNLMCINELFMCLSYLWISFANFIEETQLKKIILIINLVLQFATPLLHILLVFLIFWIHDDIISAYQIIIFGQFIPIIIVMIITLISGLILYKVLDEYFTGVYIKMLRTTLIGCCICLFLRSQTILSEGIFFGTVKQLRTKCCETNCIWWPIWIIFYYFITDMIPIILTMKFIWSSQEVQKEDQANLETKFFQRMYNSIGHLKSSNQYDAEDSFRITDTIGLMKPCYTPSQVKEYYNSLSNNNKGSFNNILPHGFS